MASRGASSQCRPLPEGKALIVLGGANANPDDRSLPTSEIRPFQIFLDGELRAARFCRGWGELDVSSLALHPAQPSCLLAIAGDRLVALDLLERRATRIPVPGLRDVHEITAVGHSLWLANTGADEAVEIDLDGPKLARRIGFSRRWTQVERTEKRGAGEASQEIDRFHCNQVFAGHEGQLFALVHHANGKQLVRRSAERILKIQGNGGVLDLASDRAFRLGLSAPHTVRRVGSGYWLLDSGEACIRVYSSDWELERTLPTRGWGRGADYAEDQSLAYIGISQTRRRYLDGVRPGAPEPAPNMVQVFDIASGEACGEIVIERGMEQINNVYLVDRAVAEALLALDASVFAG